MNQTDPISRFRCTKHYRLGIVIAALAMTTLIAASVAALLGPLEVRQQRWVTKVEAQLLSAERKTQDFQKQLAKLKALGPKPAQDDYEVYIRYTRAYYPAQDHLDYLRLKLKQDLFELWKLTSHGTPLLKHPRVKLAEASEEVCRDYRQWLEKHKDERFEDVVKNELPANIEAVRTEYCWLALDVLRTWIWLSSPPLIIVGEGGSNFDLNFTQESREAAGDAMKKWYESNKMKLQWNAHDSKFEEDGKWGFEHPRFKLE
jgi:hypothetical protein